MAEEKPAQPESDRLDPSVDTASGSETEAPPSSHAPEEPHADAAPNADDAEEPTGHSDEVMHSEADLDETFSRAQDAINHLQQTARTTDDAPQAGAPDDIAESAAPIADDNGDDSNPDADDAPGSEVAQAPSSSGAETPAAPKPSPDPTSLSELDESIADEADALLDGDFESVEEVLDDVFAHHANEFDPSQQAPSDRRKAAADQSDVGERRDGDRANTASEAPRQRRDTGKKAELAAMADDRNTGGMPGGKPDLRKISMPSEQNEAIVDRAPAAASASGGETIKPPSPTEPDATRAQADEAPEDGADDDPLEVTAHAPASLTDDEPDTDQEAEAADAPTAARAVEAEDFGTTTRHTWRDWLRLALNAIEAALRIISWPLRWLPPSMRPMVDWVALTLVFWIPIVWVVALFVVG